MAQLREIARMCPLDEGLAVYMARAALNSIDTLPKGYTNPCELVSTQDTEKWKQDTETMSRFLVYPNPNSGLVTIKYELEQGEIGIVEMHDLLGHKMFMQSLPASGGTKTLLMDGISSGLYILTLRVNDEVKLSERISIIRE